MHTYFFHFYLVMGNYRCKFTLKSIMHYTLLNEFIVLIYCKQRAS
jgi:hypothetical protein